MVYYEFNRTGKGGKYKKMSAEEYEQAKQDPKRWFLEGWDEDGKVLLYVMECSEEEFHQSRREKFRSQYLERDKSNRKAVVLSIESSEIECSYELSVFHNGDDVSIADEVLDVITTIEQSKKLRAALQKLSPREQEIIHQLFFDNRSQKELACEYGCSQQSLSKRMHTILRKLKAMMDSSN